MKILVTGGCGFIGSHLCRALLETNHEVICVDNFSTGTRINILDLFDYSNFYVVEHDVTHPIDVDVDQIYNLASPASPVKYKQIPIQTLTTNFLGTLNLVNLAHRLNIPILQASTSEIYGMAQHIPQQEIDMGYVNSVGDRSCYVEGKRAAESILVNHQRQYGTNIKIARIFNTYGPNMDENDGRIIPTFIQQALNHHPLTVHNNGAQTRSFCYVDDMVKGLIALMQSDQPGPINLGNPNEIAVLDLAKLILEQIPHSTSVIKFVTYTDDSNTQRREPDITLAKTLLGWTPQVSLVDGIRRTVCHVVRKHINTQ